MKKMTLDRIFPVINEAFRAGNRARKGETAQDTVNSINSHYKLIDYILKLLKDYGVYVYHDGCLSNMGFYSSPAGAPELTGEEHMYCVDSGPDEDPNGIFYDWFEEYVGFKPCEYVYRLIFVEIDDNTVMVGGGLNDNCDCECDTVWHWDNKDIIRKALAELAEYKKTDEAFRAGNRARKRETVQDAVSDITDVHDISADELEQALSVPNLRYKFPDVLTEVIDRHNLPVQLEAESSGIAGVSPYSYFLLRNGEQICKFYWDSGGASKGLYMHPENATISGCVLYLEMNGKGKLYRTSLERLRLVLLGLDGDDLEEAFRAGNRARKKESVHDTVQTVYSLEDQIRKFKERFDINLEIKNGRPYYNGYFLELEDCPELPSLLNGLIVKHTLSLSNCTSLKRLPKKLTVTSLILENCTELTELPDKLTVYDLSLENCTGLTSLPQKMKVLGGLNLTGCTGLTSLPQGLTVKTTLNLDGCTGLTSLPQGLNVGGLLNLKNCNGLTSLPVDMTVKGNSILNIPDSLKPFIDRIGMKLDRFGSLNAKGWMAKRMILSQASEAFKAGNKARKRETVQDTVDGVDMTAATITAALAKLEPVRRFDQESVEIMLAEFKPDRLVLTSFKDGEGAHAPRAFSIFDLRGSGTRIPCYIRPRGKKLWLTFNPADIMNSEDFIIAEADRQGKVEFGPGVQKLADILDDNYTLENN